MDVLVKSYIIEIVTRTRKHADIYLGASPRGSLTLFRAAQARAALQGRDYVIPDDIKALAPFALAHRIIVSPSARIKDVDADRVDSRDSGIGGGAGRIGKTQLTMINAQ